MTAAFASSYPGRARPSLTYRPGVCNIGPQEITRRRRAGHLGALAALGLFAILLVLDAPSLFRFAVALPAAGAATSYLQAWLHFCAGFGTRGVFNFGALGQIESVVDPGDRARDRRKSVQIFASAAAIGAIVGLIAARLPV